MRLNDGTHGGRILATLTASIGQVVSTAALLQAMYGAGAGHPAAAQNALKVTICRLRTQLPVTLQIVVVRHGMRTLGYRLEPRA
jgi:DNA-binding response OmpR family regulator